MFSSYKLLRQGGALIISILLWATLVMPACAGSFTTRPIRVQLSAGVNSTTLYLDNSDDKPVQIQTQVMAWRQQNGQDVLEETEELIVSPPIFTVPPGGTQLIRVGSLQANRTGSEISYRLFLQEVPPEPPEGETTIGVALRLSLPVFIQPQQKAAPKLTWKAQRTSDNAIGLTLVNSGTAHIQVMDCALHASEGGLVVESPLTSYVLPGQSRTWLLKPTQPWNARQLNLKARSDAGDLSAVLELE